VVDIKVLHNKRLMVNFESDEVKQERDIDNITQEITEIFRSAEASLKGFSRQLESTSDVDRVVMTNIQRSMAKKLQSLSTGFRTSQKVNDNISGLINILIFF
jgi:syntaxin 16